MLSNVVNSRPASSAIKGTILALTKEQFANISDAERQNIECFGDHARKYPHRVSVPLDEDDFAAVQAGLDPLKMYFARIPFPSINTVIYLFRELAAVRTFMSITGDSVPPAPLHN